MQALSRVLRTEVAKAKWALPSASRRTEWRGIEAQRGMDNDFLFGRGRAFCSTANANPPSNNQAPAQPQTPPPPPPPPPINQPTTSRAHDKVKAFRLFDPSEDLLRALRARREKLEALEARSEAAGVVNEASNSDANSNNTINEAATATDNSSCGAVDAIVQRFLAEHPDVSAEEEAFEDGQIGETQQDDDQGIVDAAECDALPCRGSIDDDAALQCKHTHIDARIDIPLQEKAPALHACSKEVAYEEVEVERPIRPHPAHAETLEESESEPAPPSTEPSEVQPEAVYTQVILVKKQQSKRRINSIAILDSCRVESFRMIKSAFLKLCRKATEASLRTLSRAKRKVAPSRRDHSALEVVVHRKASATLVCGSTGRDSKEDEAVVEVILQEKLSAVEQMSNVQMHSDSPSKASADMEGEAMELCEEPNAREDTPIFSLGFESKEKDTISSLPPPPHSLLSREGSLVENTSLSETGPIIPSPKTDSQWKLTTPQEETLEPSLPCSVCHVYAKSLGGDDQNEFYDASSRFGSRSSTPSRIHSNRSMSRDWGNLDDFVDATSTPFETPRTSVSERRHSFSASSPSMVCKVSRQTSKLSKRVGKALWVDTTEISGTGKAEALSSIPLKDFYSGELFTVSIESNLASNKEEPICPRRKCVSGDQASTSTSRAGRLYNKRGMSLSSQKGASNAIAVTPVFPSKCQKNRMIASASGLPRQMLAEDMQDVGWPLGISGYPPSKTCTKERADSKRVKKAMQNSGGVVPSPPLPPSPAGGSWLRKALSSNTLNQAPSRLAGLHATAVPAKKPSGPTNDSPNKWEDIVKGSHVQPGHLRFSEELHHHPPDSDINKYYAS